MMFPDSIALLLIVLVFGSCTGSGEKLITVYENMKSKPEGSCVTISCIYKENDENMTLLWFRDPEYDDKMQIFNGTIIYSNAVDRLQSPGFANRVEYITEEKTFSNLWQHCDLRINDLQKTDSGNYKFRLIGSTRFISDAVLLTVTDNPCKVNIEPSELSVKESNEFNVKCSTSESCLNYPEWSLHKPGQQTVKVIAFNNEITQKQWTENGKKITELNFKPTWEDDNTILSCHQAENQDSCLIRNVTLSVEYEPKEVKASAYPEHVREGGSVNLNCSFIGRLVTVSWFKIENEKSRLVKKELKAVKPEDRGKYYCQARNKHGSQNSSFIYIDVMYGPKGVRLTPVNVNNIKEGDELKLSCSVKDSNPAANHFTWYLNNSMLPGQTNQRLIISAVKPEDRGYYHCSASNTIGAKISENLLVAIKYSPHQITIQGETFVKVGTKLSLTCVADANPPPVSYTWTYTPELMSEQLPLPSSKTSATLNIETVSIQHAGTYTCAVTNEIGRRENAKKVDVLYPPLKPELTIKSEVREYEVISITCKVQSFPDSQLTVTGPSDLKHVHPVKSNNMITIYLNVTESDVGDYKCTAQNTYGSNHIKKTLTVLYAPKNVSISSEGEQTEGHELRLACNARSVPTPSSYEWKKISGGKLKTLQNLQTLRFKSLQRTDSGQYTCIAGNDIGKTESLSVDIKIKYPPQINLIHNMSAQDNWEHAVHLTCSAEAFPPPNRFRWYTLENKTALPHQQNLTVLPQNPGTYYCTAANEVGTSHSEHIKMFMHSSVELFCVGFFSIFLLLVFIVLGILFIRRKIIKTRSDQQSGADNPLCFFPMFPARSSRGSQNNTRENLSMGDIPESYSGRDIYPEITLHSQDPPRSQARPASTPQTLYSVNTTQKIKKGGPKQQKHDDMTSSSVNYATLEFKGKQEPAKRAPESSDSVIYAKVSKKPKLKHSEPEQPDYENVSAHAPKLPIFTDMDWESDTSDENEDEINYTTVSCTVKPGLTEPKHKSSFGTSGSDEEDRTVYAAIKT